MQALGCREGIGQVLVHTGQHFDADMSDVFFQDLGMPSPDVNLGAGPGSHARQTAEIMTRLEPVLLERRPDLALVYGDVNSTMAAALVCAKLAIPVGHVEAGLRSLDRAMPEEINRVVTDHVAELLFTPSADGDEHLLREGVAPERIHRVGNVMIDTVVRLLPEALARWPPKEWGRVTLERYGLVTLHRPATVDDPARLAGVVAALREISRDVPLIFPAHPRVRERLRGLEAAGSDSRLRVVRPLGYLDFLALERHAALVITDSGGVQEETTYLGVPCLTLRETTERPITTSLGTNILIGLDMARLRLEVARILAGRVKPGQIPPLWDGHAAARIARIITAERRLG